MFRRERVHAPTGVTNAIEYLIKKKKRWIASHMRDEINAKKADAIPSLCKATKSRGANILEPTHQLHKEIHELLKFSRRVHLEHAEAGDAGPVILDSPSCGWTSKKKFKVGRLRTGAIIYDGQ